MNDSSRFAASVLSVPINRRESLRLAGTALASVSAAPLLGLARTAQAQRPKKVIVAGAGIGGLCCAYELMERGHEVTVLEASGRAGGHVRTIHDPLPDGLYADVDARAFTQPGPTKYWKYVEKFQLPYLAYPRWGGGLRRIDGKWYTEEQLQDPAVLQTFGFNQREVSFIVKRGWTELPLLYFGPYLDAIKDEYQPFSAGLDHLDGVTAAELLVKDGASDTALRFNGLRRGDGTEAARNRDVSALYRIWQQAIVASDGPLARCIKQEVLPAQGRQPANDRHVFRQAGRAPQARLPGYRHQPWRVWRDGRIPRVRRAADARGRLPGRRAVALGHSPERSR